MKYIKEPRDVLKILFNHYDELYQTADDISIEKIYKLKRDTVKECIKALKNMEVK